MRTGVSTASLFNRQPNEESLPYLDKLGVKTAEVFLTSFSEYGKEFGSLLAKCKGQVRVHSVHDLNTQFEPQLFNSNARTKKDAYYWLGQVMSAGQELGATHYTFHGIARVKRATRSGVNDDFTAMQKCFAEIYEFCDCYGIKLCLENVEWASYNRVGVFSKIKEAVPTLGGVLDIKQARISEHPYEKYLAEMGEKLAYVHLSDIDEKGKLCLPGKGIFDFDLLLKRLNDTGFDGALLIEAYSGDYQKEEELKTACDFLKEKIYKFSK